MKSLMMACVLVLMTDLAMAQANGTGFNPDLSIGVRLNDLLAFSKDAGIAGLDKVIAGLEKNKRQFVPDGERLKSYHGAYLQQAPELSGSTTRLTLLVLASSERGKLYANLAVVDSNQNGANLKVISHTLITNTRFTGEVGLIDRKVVFTDSTNDLRITLPIGVGSFDEGILNPGSTSLLTPRFKRAALTAEATISERHKPKYFAGKPFIRIVDAVTEQPTAIGFHIEINDSFHRAYESHGCIRLREQDLMMTHDLVKYGQGRIDLTVSYRTETLADHPAPKMSTFKTVLNVGTPARPQMIIDRDYLVQTTTASSKRVAPVEQLMDSPEDHYYSIYQYEGMDTYQKQRAAQGAYCQSEYSRKLAEQGAGLREKIMTELASTKPDKSRIRDYENSLKKLDRKLQSEIEPCKKQGEHKMGLGDKLYRFWVH